jgi:hypothetical protein
MWCHLVNALFDRRFMAMMIEAVRTPETSVNVTTWRYIPED